jgi:hypothetical protein
MLQKNGIYIIVQLQECYKIVKLHCLQNLKLFMQMKMIYWSRWGYNLFKKKPQIEI